ncbi:MAG: hypothetical protein M3032_08840, partial [Verrucomicrobiota bacterium]|nr:hypothetical protein [Verrucomicrobiota bacterium]
MKKKSSPSGVSRKRVIAALTFCCAGLLLAFFALAGLPKVLVKEAAPAEELQRYMPVPGGDVDDLDRMEQHWNDRLSYPTGLFNPEWVRKAAEQDGMISRAVPSGARMKRNRASASPLALDVNAFISLGPSPERMTGCTGCYDYGFTQGRVNAIAVDPTTPTNGSITTYIATNGGGVWKSTNCCSSTTSWNVITDDPLISTTSVDAVTIDPNDHNTIYAGTGDLNFGSFSMGSQGILKSTDAGATWKVLGADVFGAPLPVPAGQFPQYQA